MKKVMVVFMCAVLASVAYADRTIEEVGIDFEYTTGATANYDADAGTLTWSGGAFSYILTDFGVVTFDSAEMTAEFSRGSYDAVPNARFDLSGTMTLGLFDNAYHSGQSPVITISAVMNNASSNPWGGQYVEQKTGTGTLDGSAWLNVTNVTVDQTWEQAVIGDKLVWGGQDSVAGMNANVSLDSGINFNSYADDYAATNGLMFMFFADQSQVIPEPATLALLGLGAVGLLRKRK